MSRDIAASVRQRLLNRARSEDRPFQELLQYLAMERFLYRLAKSSFVDRFILKGALLLTAWKAPVTRPTIDIDLAGRISNELEHIRSVVAELCQLNVEPDGVDFDPPSIEVQRIKEDADYGGVRVRFNATLAKARIPMQIDVGFGDVIVPKPIEVEYPAMLEFGVIGDTTRGGDVRTWGGFRGGRVWLPEWNPGTNWFWRIRFRASSKCCQPRIVASAWLTQETRQETTSSKYKLLNLKGRGAGDNRRGSGPILEPRFPRYRRMQFAG